MQIYLVGGAVRDALLGKEVKERDYVVVGATASELLALGYQQVGKDFPVFLHPKTLEEYALARTERKQGKGYTGFSVFADPSVTLEEDLQRRDLTVNAIAQATDGSLIDPFCGQQDLNQRLLRHVSPAFVEDPLRVLRVARFAARFAQDGFTVAPETMTLMRQITQGDELANLSAERVWRETEKALATNSPGTYFAVLNQADALTPWFAELNRESTLNKLEHLLPRQQVIAQHQPDPAQVFALFGLELSESEVKTLCKRLRVPNRPKHLALIMAKIKAEKLTFTQAQDLFRMFDIADVWRRDERIKDLAKIAGLLQVEAAQIARFRLAWQHAQSVNAHQVIAAAHAKGIELRGPQIGEAVDTERLAAIQTTLNEPNK